MSDNGCQIINCSDYDASKNSCRYRGQICKYRKIYSQAAPTFPNTSDCEHGRQRGKCPECDAIEYEGKCDRILAAIRDDALPVEVVKRLIGTMSTPLDILDAYRAALLERIKKGELK